MSSEAHTCVAQLPCCFAHSLPARMKSAHAWWPSPPSARFVVVASAPPSCAPGGTTMHRFTPPSTIRACTCSDAKIAFASEMRTRDAISPAENDSAMMTATQPARTRPR